MEVDDVDYFVIAGIPQDTPANRDMVRQHLQVDPDSLPWPPPYKNSVVSACQICGISVWIGPESHQKQLQFISAGQDITIICLICAAGIVPDHDVRIIQLTGKKAGK